MRAPEPWPRNSRDTATKTPGNGTTPWGRPFVGFGPFEFGGADPPTREREYSSAVRRSSQLAPVHEPPAAIRGLRIDQERKASGTPVRNFKHRDHGPDKKGWKLLSLLRALASSVALARSCVACLAFVLVLLPPAEENSSALLSAALLCVLIAASAFLVPWEKLPAGAQALGPLAYFVVIALLREAEGGSVSGYGALILLPICWLALYGTRGQLSVALVVMVVMFVVPIILLGEPHYPSSEWRRALMWAGVGPVVGLTVQRLVSQRRELIGKLREVARADGLTGVANRRAWDEELPRELSRARRSGKPMSVALLDLDHFKAFNDSRGHQAGDQLLMDAAIGWGKQIKDADLIARYGGEEFAVLLPNCPVIEACGIAERLREVTPGEETCSVGIACWDGSESSEALIARADHALYEAKGKGRDRAVLAA